MLTDETTKTWLRTGAVHEILIGSVKPMREPVAPPMEGVRVVSCPHVGRGIQMNEAARVATGEVLLFHHVDTELTAAHLLSLQAAMGDPQVVGGAFVRQFDQRHPHLRWLEPLEALRCRRFGPLFGDQSIFVRRSVFEAMKGFANIPLMEDVEFTLRLRKLGKLALLAPSIRSSPRKHLQQGRWRTTLINTAFLLLFAVGVSPARLHAWYYRRR